VTAGVPFTITRGVPPTWPGIGEAGRVVARFLATVRQSGDPHEAAQVMAPRVSAHQVTSHGPSVIVRTPEEYAAHVQEHLRMFGRFTFEVTEVFESGDRVYVRWHLRGHHLRTSAGEPGSGLPLSDVASAVYRVSEGRVAEYWIQADAHGLLQQLDRLESTTDR
jgi:ketosteroid isomerase-like protein